MGVPDSRVPDSRFDNNAGAYTSITGTAGVSQSYNAGASPSLTAFELSFPVYDYKIGSVQLPALIPGMTTTLAQRITVTNSSSDGFQTSTSWNTQSGKNAVQGNFGVVLRDTTATALSGTVLPATADVSLFNESSIFLVICVL